MKTEDEAKACDLPGCNKKARRRFCCNRHKDRYHNLNNPRGRYAHLADKDDLDVEDDMHPFDSYSLGQWQD